MSTRGGSVLYIAGPMRYRPEYNFPAFYRAESVLQGIGYDTINPARHDAESSGFDPSGCTGHESLELLGFDVAEALAWDLAQLDKVDAICLLDEWEFSSGVGEELERAAELGVPAFEFDNIVAHHKYREELSSLTPGQCGMLHKHIGSRAMAWPSCVSIVFPARMVGAL